jgi:hypothetical protein
MKSIMQKTNSNYGTYKSREQLTQKFNGIFLNGYFNSVITFSDEGFYNVKEYTNQGVDISILNHNISNGDILWSTVISGTSSDNPVNIIVDSNNNIYVSGYYNSTGLNLYNADGNLFASLTNTNPVSIDIFIAKYDNNGYGIWVTRISGGGNEQPTKILLDSENNIYIMGYMDFSNYGIRFYNQSNTTSDPFKTLYPSTISTFIAKYDTNGNGTWATFFRSSNSDNFSVDIKLDSENNIYFYGSFKTQILTFLNQDLSTFKTLNKYQYNTTDTDIFIVKYAANGYGLWKTVIAGYGIDQPVNMILDSFNNVYVSGFYTNSLNLYHEASSNLSGTGNTNSSTPFKTLTNAGNDCVFLAKYNKNGSGLWASKIDGAGNERPVNMILDSSNNVYISGYYTTSLLAFSQNSGLFKTLTNSGNNDIFIAKYDTSGNGIWATKIAGTGNEQPVNMILDSSNNVYISGFYSTASIELYNQTNTTTLPFKTLTNSGNNDIFIAKYDTSGNGIWATKIAGTGNEQPVNMILDSSNNVYISGFYSTASIELYNQTNTTTLPFKTLTNSGNNDIFIAKYDSSGNGIWTASHLYGTGAETPINMIFGKNSNIYSLGTYNSYVSNISNNPLITSSTYAVTLINESLNDIFIVNYTKTGFINWTTRISGTGIEQPVNMILDSFNNVYISGYYSDNLKIYNQNGIVFKTLTNSGSNDVFLAKYNKYGNGIWATRISGTGIEYPVNMILDFSNNVYVYGYYNFSSINLYNETNTTSSPFASLANPRGGNDVFLAKYDMNGSGLWATRISGTGNELPVNIVLDSANNICISGYYNASLTLYNSTDISTSTFVSLINSRGGNDVFLARYDSSGIGMFAAQISSTGSDLPINMVVDSTNNIYVSGYYNSALTLYNSRYEGNSKQLPNSGGSDIFIAKYSSTYPTIGYVNSVFNGPWATRISGTAGNEQPVNIVLDSASNLYISGYCYNNINVYHYSNQNSASLFLSNLIGTYTIFIVKISNGGTPVWINKIDGNTPYSLSVPVNMCIDSNNNIYISGTYTANLNFYSFDPTNNSIFYGWTTLTNSGGVNADIFVTKYNSNGVPLWASKISGNGIDQPVTMVLDGSNNICISGTSASTLTLYHSNGKTYKILVNTENSNMIFIAKYDSNGNGLFFNSIKGGTVLNPVSLNVSKI